MGYTTFTNNSQPALSDTTLNNMQVELMKLVFPIGSTYITQNNTNPNTILKFGTWERLKGKICLGLDEDDTDLNEIGKTGGNKTTTLTKANLPDMSFAKVFNTTGAGWTVGNGGTPQLYTEGNENVGNNEAFSNMPPYEVVGYMWIRRS